MTIRGGTMRNLYFLFTVVSVLLMAETASCEVTITGDGRVRYVVKNNYLFGNFDGEIQDSWDSRVRIVVEARSRGGAFAKVRIRSNVNWGDTANGDYSVTPETDFAYIGVPIGPAKVEAGLMKSNVTRFLEWDQDQDQLTIGWDMFGSQWTGVYRVGDESEFSNSDVDRLNDNDRIVYGAIVKKEFSNAYWGQANLFYADDQRDENTTGEYIPAASGFFWSLFLHGEHRKFTYETELAFKSSDVRQSRDEDGFVINRANIDLGDGWGWYFAGVYELGSFTPSLNIGVTRDGYEADNDFGWIMVGNSNNEPIAVVAQLGENGDWYWVAPSLLYTMTEKLEVRGNLVWVSVDAMESDDDTRLHYKNLYEVSVDLLYTITDSAGLTWKAGLLKPEVEGSYYGEEVSEDIAFGTYCRLQVHF